MTKYILITGSAGFIGRAVISQPQKSKIKTKALDICPSPIDLNSNRIEKSSLAYIQHLEKH